MSTLPPVRLVTAITRFRGSPGREQEAAEAWAFELTYYFKRGVGEAPVVTWKDGIYTCTGLMTTTHPGDIGSPVVFDGVADVNETSWSLDFARDPGRKERLRELYARSTDRWDGRTTAPVSPDSSPSWHEDYTKTDLDG